ncbi:ADP-ribosylglycohydrolase family protein [Nocardia sp. NPDC051030]|uniref:ADP-ribosylglycohydrolase family protein n=1 Tax=Nocardia sp. NPDC051030 TaxID=3155162 RepID=UPI0034165341
MKDPWWERMPPELRVRVDELIAQDHKILAIKEIREGLGEPSPGINECMDLLVERYTELSQPWIRPSPPLDHDDLVERVANLPERPDAIEAVWDGDTFGWMVCLVAVTRSSRAEHYLAQIRHGGDIRLFNGEVPPYPEAREATSVGQAVADTLGMPFHFTSPDRPDIHLPRWWDEQK